MDQEVQSNELFEIETLADWQDGTAMEDAIAGGAACNSNNSNNEVPPVD